MFKNGLENIYFEFLHEKCVLINVINNSPSQYTLINILFFIYYKLDSNIFWS
jgi:hypothetical protein